MTIPTSSHYPQTLDTNQNLYEVHDALRVRLAEDYHPGNKIIHIFGDPETINRFPTTGIITLTEQCSEPDLRAISFYYGLRTNTTFEQLELLPSFSDNIKPKNITDVTQNVMSVHHNAIKDAIKAIEKFAGKKGEVAVRPLEGTMEARINFLMNLSLTPKAWFAVNKTIGLVPMTVEFTNLSFRLANCATEGQIVNLIWDFGDNTGPSITTIVENSVVPVGATNVLVDQVSGSTILKTYTRPGIYDVTLTVQNGFGSDTIILPNLISARISAPGEAIISFVPRTNQIFTPGLPTGGPYTTLPMLRSSINTLIDLAVPQGLNPNTGKSYAGEELDGNNHALDPITVYTWSLADDLTHNNSSIARASYSVGGLYDIILRADTKFGAYRITTYSDVLDLVERDNLWLWTFNDNQNVSSYEFGLISETFKAKASALLTVGYNDSFLTGAANEVQQKREFRKNNGFAQRGTVQSGVGGTGLLYWASGRSVVQSPTVETVNFSEFNGFNNTYTARTPISRPWNWVALPSPTKIYFILGGTITAPDVGTSPTNQQKDTFNLSSLTVDSTTLANSNYKNGADELKKNEVIFNNGLSQQGHMSVYRSCWRQDTGYILRNQGVGNFFRILSFYKTSGNTAEPFVDIRKVVNMAGPTKIEGQLVPLTAGVFFFNNSGSVAAYNPTSGVWETGGPGINSASFRSFQDTSIIGFDDQANTLLAASDFDQIVYLSYDYSPKAFIKFNATNLTFSSVINRPSGKQWQINIF